MKDDMMHCHCGGGFGGKKVYMLLGTVAFVYGLMSYFMATQGWQPYTAWMVGGALLVVVGWVKMWMWKMRMGKSM